MLGVSGPDLGMPPFDEWSVATVVGRHPRNAGGHENRNVAYSITGGSGPLFRRHQISAPPSPPPTSTSTSTGPNGALAATNPMSVDVSRSGFSCSMISVTSGVGFNAIINEANNGILRHGDRQRWPCPLPPAPPLHPFPFDSQIAQSGFVSST